MYLLHFSNKSLAVLPLGNNTHVVKYLVDHVVDL